MVCVARRGRGGRRADLVRRAAPALDLAARVIEQRYGIRVPGAPQELQVLERATGAVVARIDVHSTDGVEAQVRDDLARLDAAAFAATWCVGAPAPAAAPRARDDAARARLRADLRLAGGIAALAVLPLARRLLRRQRGGHGGD